ncbi:MAG: DUF805 domain-containing protein [Xanthobacteraceae bacterium]
MTDSQPQDRPANRIERSRGLGRWFTYRGQMGRGGYWLAQIPLLGLLFGALAAFATVMNPTGKGIPELAIPFLAGFFWIHSAVTIKRLRDAGIPVWTYVIFGLGPFAWLALTLEYIEYAGVAIAVGFLAFFVIPGVLPSKGVDGGR